VLESLPILSGQTTLQRASDEKLEQSLSLSDTEGVASHVEGATTVDTDGKSEGGPVTTTDEPTNRLSGDNVIASASAC